MIILLPKAQDRDFKIYTGRVSMKCLVDEIAEIVDIDPIDVNVKGYRERDLFFVEVEQKVLLSLSCGRCISRFSKEICSSWKETFSISQSRIDLSEAIREHLLLDLPMIPICNDYCQGICVFCGEANQCLCDHTKGTEDIRWKKLKNWK